jgi:carbamoyl-phosphate synthase large subunit
MKNYTVLVTGIGGNVGQGILRNIRNINSDITIIGTNVTDFSPGNHLCNRTYKIPYAYDQGFIESIKSICKENEVNLIIPSTDYEALYLSEKKAELPKIATSDFETNRIFTDKFITFEQFKLTNIPFASSILPSKYSNEFADIILKPRKGRGSRGIFINPENLIQFTDEEYMVQELQKGVEITTAFYVTNDNTIHGHITMERKLENGTTVLSLVTKKFDELLLPIMNKMVQQFKIIGSCNIQSIVTNENAIFPFEINCRISGTNSIRSNFGFEDVKYTLEEHLLNLPISPVEIKQGAATRILMDVIYPDVKDWNDLNIPDLKNYLF